jgi:uncharacterized membrane protein (DUF106 family)
MPLPQNQLEDITHTIQLAVAPVFLLTAIGTTLSVLATRLARVVDRARALEAVFHTVGKEDQERSLRELGVLKHRAGMINRALTAGVGSALCVCLLITVAFFGYLMQVNLGQLVAVLFIFAMALFMFALVNFLREIFGSLRSLRIGMTTVEHPPERAQAAAAPPAQKV